MVSFHTKMLHKGKKKKTYLKKCLNELDLCHVLSLLPGVGRGINSQIERSRTGCSKHKPRLGGRREENQDNLLGLSLICKMNTNPKHQQSFCRNFLLLLVCFPNPIPFITISESILSLRENHVIFQTR